MSYHIQQNVQQRSLGFFFVIAFHALLIAGLISGLGSKIGTIYATPDPVQIIQEKIIVDPLPTPKEPDSTSKRLIDVITFPTTPVIPIDYPPEVDHPQVTPSDRKDRQASSITKPKLIRTTKPEYPTASTRLGEEGVTGLSLLVTADGRVTDVKLISTSGSDRLDVAAIKHAQHNWAFSPCTEDGIAVACRFQAKLVWRLDEAK